MNKLARLAFFAALSLGVLSTAANAAFIPPKPALVVNNGDNVSTLCVTLCIEVPPLLQDCGGKPVRTLHPLARELGTITTDPPPPSTTCGKGTAALQDCGDKLGNLRRVTVGQVRRIDENDQVHLVPLCDTVNRSLTQQQLNYLARGNVQGLIPTINDNDTLMAELEDHGYEANDVIGIALAPDAAVLYVSRHR